MRIVEGKRMLVSNWLGRINHVLVGDYQIGRSGQRYLSLVFLVVAVAIGFMSFTSSHFLFWQKSVSLAPDFFSGLIAVAIVAALYLRKFTRLSLTVYGIISLVLNITVTSILAQGLLGATATFLTSFPMPFLLAGAVVFSWLGIRPLVPFVWALTLMVGLVNLLSVSTVMGLWGYIMIVSASFGLMLQIGTPEKSWREDIALHFFGSDRPNSHLSGEEVAETAGAHL